MNAGSVPTPCACTSVRRVARVLARAYDASLAGSGMNVTQLAVMRAILRHQKEPLTRIAEDLAMDRTSLYRALASLQRKKWINLSGGADNRSHTATVTERGNAVLSKVDPCWARVQTAVINSFGDAPWKAFVAELQRLSECANAIAVGQHLDVRS
jgi:DNA-binding MarR family transcriptional regulator